MKFNGLHFKCEFKPIKLNYRNSVANEYYFVGVSWIRQIDRFTLISFKLNDILYYML